jgi:hypothetical protein
MRAARICPSIVLASTCLYMWLGSAQAAAEPVLSAAQLRAACIAHKEDAASDSGRACPAYLQGFLDAAAGRTTLVPSRQAAQESWTDRASRTRLGRAAAARVSAVCLDPSTSVAQLIEQVLTHANTHVITDTMSAGKLVSDTLQRFHSCHRASR